MSFLERFIQLLRTAQYKPGTYADNGAQLAHDLERRVKSPRGDGFDIDVTGDDEQDRKTLAEWIWMGAKAPAYCSPPCGRNFSEAIAWALRNRKEGPLLDIEEALDGAHQDKMARLRRAREKATGLWEHGDEDPC